MPRIKIEILKEKISIIKIIILSTITTIIISCAPKYNPENGPLAYFKTNKTRAYISTKINFENLSKGGDIYVWDFGNGVISREKNPEILYTTEGNYKVTLYVKRGTKFNTYTKEIHIYQAPKSYTITGIKIHQLSFFDNRGNSWDGSLQGIYPDVYPVVLSNNNVIYSHPVSQRKENLSPNSLPYTFQFDKNKNLTINNFSENISIILYDFDSFSTDQKISTSTPLFSINYFYENVVTPESIILTGENTLIYLNLTWQY